VASVEPGRPEVAAPRALDDGAIAKPVAVADNVETRTKEGEQLQAQARKLALTLVALAAMGGVLAAILLAQLQEDPQTGGAIAMSTLAGLFGSCVAALRSLSERCANGWEFSDGSVWPEPPGSAKKERFNQRLGLLFLFRPFLGAAVGLLVYAGLASGVFAAAEASDVNSLLFWAFLSGLFAKTLVDKLLEMFKALLGK